MEKLSTDVLEQMLKDSVLYDEDGSLLSPEDRADGLDVVRKNLAKFGEVFDDIDSMDMRTRLTLIPVFIKVVDTYIDMTNKHEELLAAGK